MPKRAVRINIPKNLGRRRTRRGRRGRRRGRRGSGMHYVEMIPVSIPVGTAIVLKYSHLVNRPKAMNFRVQYVHFVGTAAYDTESKSYHPSCIQMQLNSPYDGAFVANTGPIVLGAIPRNVKIHNPRSADWVAYNQSDTEAFATVEAVCIGKDSAATCFVRGIIHVLVRFSAEMVQQSCPNLADLFAARTIGEVSHDALLLEKSSEIAFLESRLATLKALSSSGSSYSVLENNK